MADSGPTITPAAVVDGDLTCISCGYNLHTLPIVGRCPECDYSVGGSARKRSMRFRTFADARWTRWGVAALALGLIVSVGTELFFTLLTLHWLPAHWYQVQDRSTWASKFHRASALAFSRGHAAPTLAWGIAIPMIVLARAPRPNEARRWAARLVAFAAVVATTAIFVMSVITDVSLAKRIPSPVDPLLWTQVSLVHSLLCLTAWLVLALRLTRAERGTRLLAFAAFPPIAAILSWPNVVSLLYVLFSPPRWLGGPMFAADPPPDWLKSITLWSGQWLNTMANPTLVLVCLALWAYVRAPNRFLREQAGPADTTLAAHVGQ